MPLLRIQTNHSLSDETRKSLATQGAEKVAELLGKSIDYAQIIVEPDFTMTFGGTNDLTAFLELRGLGLDSQDKKRLSKELTAWIGEAISVEGRRVYINFLAVERSDWGWNSTTFE